MTQVSICANKQHLQKCGFIVLEFINTAVVSQAKIYNFFHRRSFYGLKAWIKHKPIFVLF